MTRIVTALTSAALLVAASASAQSTRSVTYNERSVVRVNAKLRFTTMILLPDTEQILDFVCGDKDFWVVSGAQNLAYVKPAKAGASTNLNLVTASGHVYSFLLTEGAPDPDLKLYVEPDETMAPTMNGPPRFYTATQVEALKRAAEDAQKEATATKDAAAKNIDEAVRTFRATYPTSLEFPYVLKGDRKPFNVVAIYHDDRFTYIKANAAELPRSMKCWTALQISSTSRSSTASTSSRRFSTAAISRLATRRSPSSVRGRRRHGRVERNQRRQQSGARPSRAAARRSAAPTSDVADGWPGGGDRPHHSGGRSLAAAGAPVERDTTCDDDAAGWRPHPRLSAAARRRRNAAAPGPEGGDDDAAAVRREQISPR